MDDSRKSKAQLIEELQTLRSRLADLQQQVDDASETATLPDSHPADDPLPETADRLRAMLDAAVDPIISIDEQGAIHSVNHSVVRLFGYTADELRGQNVNVLMPEPYHSEHDRYLQNYLSTGEKHIIGIGREVVGRHKDGTTFPVHLAVSEYRVGDRRFFTGIVRDISDLKKVETEQRLKTTQLEAAYRELDDFSYVVSHDLKAPLRGINSLASWVAADNADILDEQSCENLRLLIERSRRLDRLIDGILRYSRIGRQALRPRAIDTHKLVQETIDALAAPPNISVSIVDSLPVVHYDRTQLTQVFQNLIGNAIVHLGKPSGSVWVSCHDADEFWEFCVRDDGVGIEERHLERIFKIFQTLAVSDEGDSTGVGLALVKKIVEQQGGTVSVNSVPLTGSQFLFTIHKRKEPL